MSEDDKLDPIRIWREWMIKSEKQWSDHLSEIMGDERFSKGMGRYVQEGLHTHRIFSDAMAQYLSSLNLPSRADVLDIGDRLGQIEDTLDYPPRGSTEAGGEIQVDPERCCQSNANWSLN